MRTELWLTEGAELSAHCSDPAELLNALGEENIQAAEVRDRGDLRFTFFVRASEAERARKIGVRCGVEITVVRRRGSRHFWRRFRRRFFLLVLPAMVLLPFLYLSTFLWEIEVTGNVTVSDSEILAALEKVGVYPGVSGLHLDNPQIRSRMQALIPELIWCTVQVRGSRARVVVRERRLPPEIVDNHLEREVAAEKAGTVEELRVLQGAAAVRRGDTVLPGSVLISGTLTDRQAESRRVHAQGQVFARTWYEKTMELPLTVGEKQFTGDKTERWGLKIGDLTLNFFNDGSISYADYDKISHETQFTLFGLGLPLCVLHWEYREYALLPMEVSRQEAGAALEERLLTWLRNTAPEAEILETGFQTEITEDRIRVSMLASCREEIGTERPLS